MVEAGQIVIGLSVFVSALMCTWRFYVRVVVARRWELQEFTLLLTLAMLIAFAGCQLKTYHLSLNIKGPNDVSDMQLFFFVGFWLSTGVMWGVKITINLLHIQLAHRIPKLHKIAIFSIYVLIFQFILSYITYIAACYPVNRRWEGPFGKVVECKPILRAWDYWLHTALNIATDIWLLVLPFPALLQVSERRLRLTVCGVYSLAVGVIAVTAVRAALLGANPGSNIRVVMVLTMIELATSICIACVPGISSVFTRKYVYGSTGAKNTSRKNTGLGGYGYGTTNSVTAGGHNNKPSPQLGSSILKSGTYEVKRWSAEDVELTPTSGKVEFEESLEDQRSGTGSTDGIVQKHPSVHVKENRESV